MERGMLEQTTHLKRIHEFPWVSIIYDSMPTALVGSRRLLHIIILSCKIITQAHIEFDFLSHILVHTYMCLCSPLPHAEKEIKDPPHGLLHALAPPNPEPVMKS